MKALRKLLLTIALPFLATSLSACSGLGLMGTDEAVSIEDITYVTDEDGNTIITITYTDMDRDPVVVTIPKGNDGEMGNGIKEVLTETDQFGVVTVTIKFTNTSMPDKVVTLQPGKGISGYDTVLELDENGDPTGNLLLTFYDSEGQPFDDPIVIQKGDTGEQGVGIEDITYVINEQNETTITIIFDDGRDPVEIFLPAPAEGKGIESIVSAVEDGEYVLYISYTTGGQPDRITFDAPPSWSSGAYVPDNSVGMNGDFFFDTAHGVIYQKQGGSWQPVVVFSTDETLYTVRFDLNDTNEEQAVMPTGYINVYQIQKSQYFASTGKSLPIPVRAKLGGGYYTFEGWCTSKDPGPTNGYFTDLTPVFTDLTLYAIWSD